MRLDSLIQAHRADIGVAIIGDAPDDTFFYHGDNAFTMMSVVKFPQAVALMHMAGKGELDLNTLAIFDSIELKRNTWSPLAEEHPYGTAQLTILEGFKYSVSKSDNIVCDKLYDFLPPAALQNMLHKMGYPGIHIRYAYKNLSKDSLHLNSSTPRDMAYLLRDFYAGKHTRPADRDYLLNLMRTTETGPKRLKGLLPGVSVAHKTGTYFESDSFINAINDVGIVEPGDGVNPYCIVVFVNNSLEGELRTQLLIAEINRMAYGYFLQKAGQISQP